MNLIEFNPVDHSKQGQAVGSWMCKEIDVVVSAAVLKVLVIFFSGLDEIFYPSSRTAHICCKKTA